MTGREPFKQASVEAYLRMWCAGMPGPPEATDLAVEAATAWRRGTRRATGPERWDKGVNAVVDLVYPRAFTEGQRAGSAAVSSYIGTAAQRATSVIRENWDPDRALRRFLARVAAIATNEAKRSQQPDATTPAEQPPPRTFLAAFESGPAHSDARRAATAARTAWTHGYRDGWSEAYWSANRIVNAARRDETATQLGAHDTPIQAWLDVLVEQARRIATDGPDQNAARLARSAGSSQPPTAAVGGEHPTGPPTTHRRTPRPRPRRPPGM